MIAVICKDDFFLTLLKFELENRVDFEKCRKLSVYLQNSASIQKTSVDDDLEIELEKT